jgi:beta-glucuronidase
MLFKDKIYVNGGNAMLFPITTDSRTLSDLSGVCRFMVDKEIVKTDVTKPLPTKEVMAVPASFNDQGAISEIRNHSGFVWYETEFSIAKPLLNERIVLRFGSVTHEGWVFVNGQPVTYHKGGFTPFEAEINNVIQPGKNRLTVKVSNILDYTTLPVGNYSEKIDENGHLVRKVEENFDFFNYAGIHRPVKIYTTPFDYISDVLITPIVDLETKNAEVQIKVETQGDFDVVKVTFYDEESNEVASASGKEKNLIIKNVHSWQPLNSYLYTAKVEGIKNGEVVDIYEEPFGIRSVEVKEGKFLINGEPFYFKGYGKHEDTYINGRGINEAANVLDLNLLKYMGANSFRTSHYPYSEEMMRLCDREGIVVIDETTAVGLFENFSFVVSALEGKSEVEDLTWKHMQTKQAHEQVIRELIARDKNHACVVMWSIANEPATNAQGSYEYFEPLFKLAKKLDPQKRPCTYINIMLAPPEIDKCADLTDVIALNRYYGWYTQLGDLNAAEAATRLELQKWVDMYPDKPIIYTEYGADTVAGLHALENIPFTEEYQVDYYAMNHKVFDEFSNFVGEQLWNFADFETKVGLNRVQGNKKGVFNRSRQPKMVVRTLRDRWKDIPDFGYKK